MLAQTILITALGLALPAQAAWKFTLFSNRDIGSCVEEVSVQSGASNTDCVADFLDLPEAPEERAFIGNVATDGCQVEFFSNTNCAPFSRLGFFDASNVNQCQATLRNFDIRAYKVSECKN